jgi:uncharacterized SAM-binding protein YcdF (DUF218 family)
MFFVASKIGWLIAQPSSLLSLGVLVGIILVRTRFAEIGRLVVLVAGTSLGICALTPFSVVLIRPLEDRFPALSLDDIQNPEGIIVLGGALNLGLTRARGPIALGTSPARMTEAVALAYHFPNARLVFSGGSVDLAGTGEPEGNVAKEFLSELGVSADRVIIEGKSRNTSENAQFTRDLIKPRTGDRWVLVTSAFHMPRAVALFHKAGVEVVPYPVDYKTLGDRRDYLNYTFAPVAAMALTDTAAKEWIGVAVYWLSGKTAELQPPAQAVNAGRIGSSQLKAELSR